MELASELRAVVQGATPKLRAMTEDQAEHRPAPGKWSPKEILGHLIDSASNNHQRFVRARSTEDLRFPGYPQDDWVLAGDYVNAPWSELVALWESFNLQIARVVAHTPANVLQRERPEHNLDQIAWEDVPRSEPATLAYFVRDYCSHMCHHLRQIDPSLAPEPRMQRSE